MSLRFFVFILALAGALAGPEKSDFVLIHGGSFPLGRTPVRLDDFEMLDHPVTNAEYALFVNDTGHAPPLHWERGRIPAGLEQWPVIFVNRYDVEDYTKWRTRKERRVYRLPTVAEFDYAARAGTADSRFFWGNESPAGRANYDPSGDRGPDEWRRYLKPVRSFPPNRWGLYDMAGNVWQMVDSYPDPARQIGPRFPPVAARESSVAGGSWARTDYFLRAGVLGSEFAGIRHADLGFRVVREPQGSTHFRLQTRRLVAAPAGQGAVFVSWQLLPKDAADAGFHVYRSTRRDTAGDRITRQPIRDSTNFVDREPGRGGGAGGRVYYRVRPVLADGKEGPPSEWAGAEPGANRSGLLAMFEPTIKEGAFVPTFGDLDGDGQLDAVLRVDNGIRESMPDPGVPVELIAFSGYGKALWRRPVISHAECFGNAYNAPFAVYDLDGDGKAEVITRLQEGESIYLAVLDGLTGRVLRRTPWPRMVTDSWKTATRIHLAVAYLDGNSPAIVTQTGLYENEIIAAYDSGLKKLWEFDSFGVTSGSGSHHVDIADVDGDGKDEVFDGTTLLNPDGTVRWSLGREHPDIVAINHILPGLLDRQVFFAVESNLHAGAYVVDAKSGKSIWKVNRETDPRWVHAHMGWVADIWEGSPGKEVLTNRDGHLAQSQVLFAADGKVLMDPFPPIWRPVNWTGGKVRDLISDDGRMLARFDGKGVVPIPGPGPNELSASSDSVLAKLVGPIPDRAPDELRGGNCNVVAFGLQINMVADLAGDFRDEVVCVGTTKRGSPAIFVFTNIEPVARREVTRTANREYRLWMARNIGGGYPAYFEWEP